MLRWIDVRNLAWILIVAGACSAAKEAPVTATIRVTSTAFADGGRIPKRHAYGGEGDNVSPPLAWEGVPDGTKRLALICDDPDAPRPQPWVHWVLFGLDPTTRALPAGLPADGDLSGAVAARQGVNSWDELGWGGPMPPKGHGTHHYHFRLYALDAPTGLEHGATKDELLAAMKGHVLATGELVGTYER